MKTDISFLNVERIKSVMHRLGISEAMLARHIGVPQATVSRILSGATKDPRICTVIGIARVLGTTIDSLVDNGTTSTIPIIDWHEINHFVNHGVDALQHQHWIDASKPSAKGSFAVRTTPSMAPRYRTGSTIIVEPTEHFRDFQVAIVSFNGSEPAVRRLIKDGSRVLLKSLDAAPATAPTVVSRSTRIIGVVTEARMPD